MSQPVDSMPMPRKRKGSYFPAEWHRHTATWLSWPHNPETWPNNLSAAQDEFVGLVKAIANDEPVKVMAGPPEQFAAANRAVGSIPDVEVIPIPTNDAWARDYAPTFTIDAEQNELTAVDWRYNAWGGKYPPYDDDQKVAKLVANTLRCRYQTGYLCLEGGALEVDESGLLLSTRTCALDPNRNPGLTLGEIERRIAEPLNVRETIWLFGDAIIGDDTDGHIDQLARFTPTGSILYAWSDDPADPQRKGLGQNLRELRDGLEKLGRGDSLVPLPLPDPVYLFDARLPACYCNFYVTNASVIVPAFGDAKDEIARGIIAEHFPGRKTVSLPSTNLSVGLGSFHCLTQQQPDPCG